MLGGGLKTTPLGKIKKEITMSKNLSIDLLDIQKIISSDWDDNAIRIKIGEFVLQKAIKQDSKIKSLINTKFIKEPKGLAIASKKILSRCCRGHV